ncbi:MAG: GTPase [archaeon]|jgi:ribosome-interacting GTPase 1|nr:TGS domain-containing protein [archaeon]MDD2477825.1 TGS domain-containing protein [Candidatus ainarchaeum sp.]MDD3084663.1 TGS domain-containing protein [Candidatus ainarchaeum sp.]MDD4221209.1 TGS domain-containing protein [Candidatus ainarchaeum sp.]MDD4662716.1 TGS domain-containing protein [Candidatus ainarchaeum sp.]
MPANVSFEFSIAQKKYDDAKTDEEKIVALQDMVSKAPGHKGAENLRKDLSRKLSSLKNKIEKQALTNAKRSGNTINIKKEGAGQVVIVGLANTGKSTFLSEFTNSKPLIAPYPYSTTKPEVGILNYGGALIQLVELPSFLENHDLTSQIYSMIRTADLCILIIKNGLISELETLIKIIESKDVFITKKKPKISFTKSDFLGISFINEQNLLVPKAQAIDFLRSSGFRSQNIILNQKTTMEDLLLLVNPRASFVPTIIVSMPFARNIKKTKYKDLDVFDFSQKEEIIEKIFELLEKVIVYTKKPGQKADKTEPLVLKKGETIVDAAKIIHKTIYKNLKSAKVWGSTKFPGQVVSKKYVLKNHDVVEFNV